MNGGVKINGGLEYEKRLYMSINCWKKQKRIVRQHKTEGYKKPHYFAMTIGYKVVTKKGNKMSKRVGKHRKINKGVFIWHLRVASLINRF